MTGTARLAELAASVGPGWVHIGAVASVADDAGLAVWAVGGAVRDLLLGRPIHDVDLVVEGDAVALAEALVRRHGGRHVRHGEFGTAKWSPGPGEPVVDLASARTETYAGPASLPSVSSSDIHADLARRDFTINAMALGVSEAVADVLLDPHGGGADLIAGQLRALHAGSFVDDPTRGLRAARFASRFGMSLVPETAGWLVDAMDAGAFSSLGLERLGAELERVLGEADPLRCLQLLAAWGVPTGWEAFDFEPTTPVARHLVRVDAACAEWRAWAPGLPVEPRDLRWMVLSDVLTPEQRRARVRLVSGGRARQALFLAGLDTARAVAACLDGVPQGQAGHVLRPLDPATLSAVALVGTGTARTRVAWWGREGRVVRLAVDGRDLLRAGVPRGPAVGRALTAAWGVAWEGGGRSAQLEAARAAAAETPTPLP